MLVKGGGNAAAWTQDGGAFALNVRVSGFVDDRIVYGWSIFVDGALLAASTDGDDGDEIRGPGFNRKPDALGALGTLLSFLGSEADRYRSTMGQREPDEGYHFGPEVAEWAYMVSDELEGAALEVEALIEA